MLAASRRRETKIYDEYAGKAFSLTNLNEAIKNNRVDLVRDILANRERNNSAPSEATRATSLHRAVRESKIEIVRCLINSGTDVNRTSTDDRTQETPLGTAVRVKNDNMVRVLLDHGACPNMSDACSRTPLYQAVFYNQYNQAEMLLECGSNVNAADKQGFTPLHISCKTHGAHDQHKMISLLLNHGANPNRSSIARMLPIDLAVQKRDHNTVQMLLEAGSVEGLNARLLMTEIDGEDDEDRRNLLQKDPCYRVIARHRERACSTLATIALKRLRVLLAERERRTGRSILLAARDLPIPLSLKNQLFHFVGPNRDFLS